jgi:transmembrane sensor
MSEHTTPSPSSAAIEEAASDWLQRQRFFDWNDAAQAQLDYWLGQSLAHKLAYWRLEAAWDRTERLKVLRAAEKPLPKAVPRQPNRWIFAVGAAVALAAVAVVVTTQTGPRKVVTQTYATAPGGHKTITLTDGSQIELNTNTVLRIAAGNPRNVWLDKGEAYFEIRHNDANPFVVIAAGHRVTDLGTKFLLRSTNSRVSLSLVEGRARIDSIGPKMQPHSAVLSPGQVAVATANSLSTSTKPAVELDNELGWRRGIVVFHHTTLDAAVAEFNRYGNERLVVADEAVGALMLNGTFPTHDTQAFIRVAQQVLHLKVEKNGGQIVLSR